MYRKITLSALLLIGFLACVSIFIANKWPYASQRAVNVTPLVYGHIEAIRMMPTHFFVDEDINKQIVSDFANSRFIYRSIAGKDVWKSSNMPSLARPHALTYSPEAERYFAVDTDNHQLISFSSFDATVKDDVQRFSQVGETPIGRRPHDIAYNNVDKHIYVVLNNGVLQIEANKGGIVNSAFLSESTIASNIRKNQPDIHFNVGYVRSISIVDGALYLSNSTQGNVIQIDDFYNPSTWIAHINKNQPRKYAEKGSFDKDGLIINDIEYFEGYWYASNYYAGNVNNYLSEAAVSKNKLIRWKSLADFENSKWEDLSSLVHPESVTYNFTRGKNALYLSMFHNGNDEGVGSGVYEIKTGYF